MEKRIRLGFQLMKLIINHEFMLEILFRSFKNKPGLKRLSFELYINIGQLSFCQTLCPSKTYQNLTYVPEIEHVKSLPGEKRGGAKIYRCRV